MATYPGQALPLPGPENKALNKYKAMGDWSQRPSMMQIHCCVGTVAPGASNCGQGNIFLPIPQSNQLGILWPSIGTEKQDDWSKVTQPLVVEQDSQQVCGTTRNVFLHPYKRDDSKAEWGSLQRQG